MDNDLYRNLGNLLKIFQNKPNQLAKFLIDAEALTSHFQKKIKSSSRLQKIDEIEIEHHFSTIDELKDYYDSFLFEKQIKKSKSRDDIHKELLEKIQAAIQTENYEEAARIRDYMIKNNFKRN